MKVLAAPMILAAGFLWSCGGAQEGSQVKVSNGKVIEESEYPSVVMLYDKAIGGMCTGTFIDDHTVITAAHCTMSGKIIDKTTGLVDVRISYIRMVDTAAKKVQVMAESTEVYRNPKWDGMAKLQPVNGLDLAIVRFPAGTAPAISEFADTQPVRGDKLTIVGFGLNYVPTSQADVKPESAGIKRVGTNSVYALTNGFIQFFGKAKTTDGTGEGANASVGDSGGPLFIDGKLAGITSGGGFVLVSGVSLYVDLSTDTSRGFLDALGF